MLGMTPFESDMAHSCPLGRIMSVHSRATIGVVLSSTLFDEPLLLGLGHLVLPPLSLGFFDGLLPFLTISD